MHHGDIGTVHDSREEEPRAAPASPSLGPSSQKAETVKLDVGSALPGPELKWSASEHGWLHKQESISRTISLLVRKPGEHASLWITRPSGFNVTSLPGTA